MVYVKNISFEECSKIPSKGGKTLVEVKNIAEKLHIDVSKKGKNQLCEEIVKRKAELAKKAPVKIDQKKQHPAQKQKVHLYKTLEDCMKRPNQGGPSVDELKRVVKGMNIPISGKKKEDLCENLLQKKVEKKLVKAHGNIVHPVLPPHAPKNEREGKNAEQKWRERGTHVANFYNPPKRAAPKPPSDDAEKKIDELISLAYKTEHKVDCCNEIFKTKISETSGVLAKLFKGDRLKVLTGIYKNLLTPFTSRLKKYIAGYHSQEDVGKKLQYIAVQYPLLIEDYLVLLHDAIYQMSESQRDYLDPNKWKGEGQKCVAHPKIPMYINCMMSDMMQSVMQHTLMAKTALESFPHNHHLTPYLQKVYTSLTETSYVFNNAMGVVQDFLKLCLSKKCDQSACKMEGKKCVTKDFDFTSKLWYYNSGYPLLLNTISKDAKKM